MIDGRLRGLQAARKLARRFRDRNSYRRRRDRRMSEWLGKTVHGTDCIVGLIRGYDPARHELHIGHKWVFTDVVWRHIRAGEWTVI